MNRFSWPRVPLSMRSLRAQLLLWVALPVVIGLFALSLTELRSHERVMQRLVQERADNLTQAAASLIAARLDREKDRLIQVAADPTFHSADPDEWPDQLAQFHLETGESFAIFDASGRVLATDESSVWQQSEAVGRLVRATMEAGRPQAETLAASPEPWLLIGLPQPSPDEARVLIAAMPVSKLNLSGVLAPLALGQQSALIVSTADERVLLRLGEAPAPNTSKLIVAEAVEPLSGWRVVLRESWEGLVPPLLRFESVVFAVVAIAVFVSLLSAYFGLRNIVQPLRRLDEAAGRVGWGDFDAIEAPVGGVQEIQELHLALAQMARQLRQYQQELQSYIGAMTLGQEEERKRLARELHDGVVQALIALNQQAEFIERRVTTDPENAVARLRELRPLISDTIGDLRRQIHDLRPLYLEDLGFVPALEMLVKQVCTRHNLIGDFEVSGEPPRRLPPDVEISAYRIVQEALRNVAAHAQATWVHVELIFDEAGITLRIEDDGVGFNAPGHPFSLAQEGHYGLLGMQERAQLHGGWLRVESEPGKGATVTARLAAPGVTG